MATAGTDQLRLKTDLELLSERRSLEAEINDLIKTRGEVQQKYGSVDKRLANQMRVTYSELETNARNRLSIEEAIAFQTDRINHTSGNLQKFHEAQLVQLERQVRDFNAREDMIKLEQKLLEEQLKIQISIKDAEEKRFEKGMSYVAKLGDIFKVQQQHYMNLKASTTLQGKQLMLASSLFAVFQMMVETFKVMDAGLAKFRISMGMMRADAKRISESIINVATQFAHVGVTIEGAASAVAALANEFGGTMKISKDLVETTSLLKSQLGVAEETSAGFMRNMGALSRSTAQSQKSMVYFTDALSSAAGIPLNMVMQDVSKMSGNALAMISKMPLSIVKSAVAARQMGTTINKMADASANILNFTESVQAEMEASVLVGEAVNLQLARQLAYQGRIVDSTKAIVAEAKRINFEKLDYFQMQSFAAASGRSVDELLKMIQAERQLNEARNNASLGLQKEVAAYDRLMGMKDADLKNEGLQREMMIKKLTNQARLDQLQQQWNQLWMETMRVMYPLFSVFLGLASVLVRIGPQLLTIGSALNRILGITTTFSEAWSSAAAATARITLGVAKFGDGFVVILSRILSPVKLVWGFLSKFPIILNALKFAAPFAKAIPVVGWIITGFQFIYNMFERYQEFTKAGDNPIVAGLKAIGFALYDTLLAPFVGVWNWIKKIFVGNSPSELGLGIVRGIIGVQAMIFDALTYPFRHFLAWVADKIPGMGGIAKKLRAGMGGALEDVGVLEKKAQTPETKNLALTTEATPSPTSTVTTVSSPEEQKKREQDSMTLTSILGSLKELNANLTAGKIGIYIDGQLMSATLSRQTGFKGGYGMNMV